MKRIFTALIGLLVFTGASAQSFNKGDVVANFGIGLGNTLYNGSGYKTSVPPLSASFEYGIVDHLFDDKSSIGVGGYFGYTSSKFDNMYNSTKDEWKYSSAIISARGSFHYSFLEKLDTYTGLSLGYNIVSTKPDHKGLGKTSSLFVGWYAGARYYFTDAIAAMAEVGYDVAYLNIGVAIKF